MRDYGMVSPRFWIGETGRKLRKSPDAQRIAMYLLTAPMADMTGVFYCPVATILNDVGAPCEPLLNSSKGLSSPSEGASTPLDRGFEGVKKALLTLQELGFCVYDFESEFVFVKEMARWQIAPKLKPSDNRSKGLRKTVENMPNPMRALFIARYNEDFALGFEEPELEKMLSECEGLISLYKAPSKPLPSQEQEQEQEQDINKDVSDETSSSANASESVDKTQPELLLNSGTGDRTADEGQTTNEEPKPAKRNPPLPFQKVIDLYNAHCTPSLPSARLTDKRKDEIRLRWKDLQQFYGLKTEEETLAAFEKFFERVSESDFLNGRTDAAFRADLPWLLQREKFDATLNGRYDKRERTAIDRNGHKGTSPLPDHLNPHLRFDAAYYADAKKPDGTTDWGV